MFAVEDILARIQKGESADDIAAEFTKSINAAMELDKEQKAKEAARQKEQEEKAALEAKLDACVSRMLEAMTEYITLSEPELVSVLDEADVLNPAEVRKTLDMAVNAAKLALTIAETFEEKPAKKLGSKLSSIPTSNPDDAINQFLKNFGL